MNNLNGIFVIESGNQDSGRARKTRTAVTLENLKTCSNMMMANAKPKEITSAIGLSSKAIYKMITNIHHAKENNMPLCSILKKYGPKSTDMLSVSHRKVLEIIQDDCSLTQKGIGTKLKAEGLQISQPTISNILSRNEITRKRLVKKSDKVISPEVLKQRKVFSMELRRIPNNRILYLDETGFNLHTTSHYGYSPKNVSAVRLVPANRGRNISLLAITSSTGILHHKMIDGAYNTQSFICFLKECLEKGILSTNKIIIMDNVKFHHGILAKEWLTENSIIFKYLPPYSPQLNPIEEIFSVVKSRYHNIRPQSQNSQNITM